MNYDSIDKSNKWVPLHLRDNLTFLHILGIAFSNLSTSVIFMILPTFFEPLSSKLHVSKLSKNIILFVASFIGFIASPLASVYSDSCTFRYGRRRIFMVVSLFLILVGFLTMCYCCEIGKFLNPDNPIRLQQLIFGFSYEFAVLAGNILFLPGRSLCSDVTPIHQQNLMANICTFFAGLGGIIMNVIGGLRLYEYTSLSQEQFVLIISAILCTIPIIISIIVSPEEPLTIKPPCVNPFRDTINAIRDMPKPIKRTLPSMLFAQIVYFQFSMQFNHFMGKDIFKGDNSDPTQEEMVKLYDNGVAWSMFCGAMRYGSQSLFGFCNTKLIEILGYKWNTIIGYLCLTIGEVFFLFIDNRYAYLFIPLLIGIGYGVELTVPYAISSICIITHNLNMGAYFGLLNIMIVVGEQFSNLGLAPLISLIWKDNPRMMIGLSSIPGLIATALSFLIIEPTYQQDTLASLALSTDTSIALTES